MIKNFLLVSFIIFLTACSSNNNKNTKKPEPGLFSKDASVGINITELLGSRSDETSININGYLWRASLDVLSIAPLISTDALGGIIITDWYSDETNSNESIKITIRFLTNEIRSDALDIKIFKKDCDANQNCSMYEEQGEINLEIKKSILKKAALYEKEKRKNNKKYKGPTFEGKGKEGGSLF